MSTYTNKSKMAKEDILFQTLGELKQANRNIAESMKYISDNLKSLNDHHIVHIEKNTIEHNLLSGDMLSIKNKYFRLIIALSIALLLVIGVKESVDLFLPMLT